VLSDTVEIEATVADSPLIIFPAQLGGGDIDGAIIDEQVDESGGEIV